MATAALENRKRQNNYLQKKLKLTDNLKKLQLATHENLALQKNTSNLFRQRHAKKKKIDVRKFNKVLHVDADNFIVEVEGMTTYEDLVKACLKHARLPAVVPELKSITVGGALAGGAIESSSFKYGLVHESILEFEVLLGDGQVVICRPDNEHRDLFFGFPNSYGTLGYALKLKMKLVPSKKHVKLTHRRFTESELFFAALAKECQQNKKDGACSFIEGVVFNPQDLYLSQAEFIDQAPHRSNYKYKNIYYRSIAKRKTDYLTAKDYIWRWDSDWFWCSKFFFMQNQILRLLFGKFLLKSTAYWKIRNFINKHRITSFFLDKFQKNKEAVIQDVQIPIQNAHEFLDFFHKEIGIKPIWICPTLPQGTKADFSFYPLTPDTLYINFGFWDVVDAKKSEGYHNKLLEKKVRELGGYKGLYSNVYYSEKEFWDIYDKETYLALKKKYDPKNRLGDLYQKCVEK